MRFVRAGLCVYSPSEMNDPNTLYELSYLAPSALDQTFSDMWLEAQSTCEREQAEAANTE